jgi:hypothetical protein
MASTPLPATDPFSIAMSLVVPLRHEFRRSVDVALLLKDSAYARSIIDLANTSQNQELRHKAARLDAMIFGPRGVAVSVPVAPAPHETAMSQAPDDENLDELRKEAMKRYQGGLR